ncbi:hypothetical protein LPJ53_005745, partial [Coemansia erecta]
MDSYFSALLNISRGRSRRSAAGTRSASTASSATTTLPRINIQDESILRKTIQRIAHGDYAHLPSIADIKALFNSPQHRKILSNAYSTLQLTRVSIDETTARVISVILLSRQCQCRHLKLYRCAFTDAGKKILFSALSMMADQPPPKRRRW